MVAAGTRNTGHLASSDARYHTILVSDRSVAWNTSARSLRNWLAAIATRSPNSPYETAVPSPQRTAVRLLWRLRNWTTPSSENAPTPGRTPGVIVTAPPGARSSLGIPHEQMAPRALRHTQGTSDCSWT